jgi:antitoxin HigA-1
MKSQSVTTNKGDDEMTVTRKGNPSWQVHPGKILREECLKPMRLSAYELAKRLHVPAPRVNDIVLERRGISVDTAVRLARFFGTTEQFWLNLQANYEINLVKREHAAEIEKIEPRTVTSEGAAGKRA